MSFSWILCVGLAICAYPLVVSQLDIAPPAQNVSGSTAAGGEASTTAASGAASTTAASGAASTPVAAGAIPSAAAAAIPIVAAAAVPAVALAANATRGLAAAASSQNDGGWYNPNLPLYQQGANFGLSSGEAPVAQFFGAVVRGEVLGLRKCKKPKDCGLGLRCDLLLNLCVPFNTPIMQDIEKACLSDSDCSGMHACQGGLCRFCGPKSCRSNLDCCGGSFAQPGQHANFYECMNIEETEKLSIARQLGRVPPNFQPIPKSAGGKSLDDAYEVESTELLQLGLPVQDSALYGKRCWARCNVDTDCYHERTPLDIKNAMGCCNNVCGRKASCTVLSPQVIQQAQLLQQQRTQQQLVFQQQRAQVSQQQLLQGQVHRAAAAQPPPPQVQYFAVPVQVSASQPARPQSWSEAQYNFGG